MNSKDKQPKEHPADESGVDQSHVDQSRAEDAPDDGSAPADTTQSSSEPSGVAPTGAEKPLSEDAEDADALEDSEDAARVDDAGDTAGAEDEPLTLSGKLHHFRWDLDKTYLQTDFDSLGALVRTYRQSAEDKVVVPGARTLLQELLHADAPETPRRVSFVSGSPRQMRKVLTERLRLDGIEPAHFILKPNLSNILTLRLRAVRGQVGYKLDALLRSRIYADEVHEVFFGDDAEQDAFIYSLYGDLVAGIVQVDELTAVLEACRTYTSESRAIIRLVERLRPQQGKVGRIFIHLERRSPTLRFNDYGPRVVPVFNWFQAAALLTMDGLLAEDALMRVLRAMDLDGYTPMRISNSLQDLYRRGFIDRDGLNMLLGVFKRETQLRSSFSAPYVSSLSDLIDTLPPPPPPPSEIPDKIDYLSLVSHTRFRREPFKGSQLPFLE